MADNSSIPVASGNETFANKDIGGVKYPRHIIADNTGADVAVATAANQATANTSLAAIETAVEGTLTVDLPAGAATAANQSTGNTSLATIATNTTDVATQTTLSAINTKTPSLGQATEANSVPVILPSATITTLTPPTTVTANLGTIGGAATAANQTTANTTLSSINTTLQGDLSIAQESLEDPYSEYETVAASQTDQVLGATGATGDYLAGIWMQPDTADCGSVVVKDGATTIYTFPGGGTTALPTLSPIPWLPGITATGAGFSITTGANVSVMAIGRFT